MTLPAGYFDDLYARSPDPWGFTSRWYEQRKYALTLAALTRPRYRTAFEPGCSVGVLTERLAERCDALLASDVADAAVEATRARLAGRPGVTVERRAVPDGWPDGRFELVLVSELGYYLDPPGLARLVAAAVGSLAPDGELVCVHWRHPVGDYPQRGDAVHAAFAAAPGLARRAHHVETDFLLDVFAPVPPPETVAAREGLC